MNASERNLMRRVERELMDILKAANEDRVPFLGDEFHEVLAGVKAAAAPKLTPVQAKVMSWVSKGWSLEQQNGTVFHINGAKVCNLDTVTSLQKLGLIKKVGQWSWGKA